MSAVHFSSGMYSSITGFAGRLPDVSSEFVASFMREADNSFSFAIAAGAFSAFEMVFGFV